MFNKFRFVAQPDYKLIYNTTKGNNYKVIFGCKNALEKLF